MGNIPHFQQQQQHLFSIHRHEKMKERKLKSVLKQVGTKEIARKIGLRPATVRGWITDGVPEIHHAYVKNIAQKIGIELTADDLK